MPARDDKPRGPAVGRTEEFEPVGRGSTQGSCKKGNDEYTFKGTITAASTTGTGIPAKGDPVSASACVSSAGKITLVPHTVMDL